MQNAGKSEDTTEWSIFFSIFFVLYDFCSDLWNRIGSLISNLKNQDILLLYHIYHIS